MRSVAVVGSGISGLSAAYELAAAGLSICLYEKTDNLGGGRVNAAVADGVQLDLGFMLFNRVTSPNMMEFCERLGVELEDTDMSFSLSLDKGFGYEWGNRNGLSSVFAQKTNIVNPYFWKIIRELTKFKDDIHSYLDEVEKNPDMYNNDTLKGFIDSRGYSDLFQTSYLIPICASVWAVSSKQVMDLPALFVLQWLLNNQMLQLSGCRQWLAVKGQSRSYVDQVVKELKHRDCQIRTESEVYSISTSDEGCTIYMADGSKDLYDGCILAVHASNALKLLGNEATHDETRVLGAFQYAHSDLFLHQDKGLMPRNPTTWGACNFVGSSDNQFSVTYWLNVMQNIDKGDQAFFVTINPPDVPKDVLLKWSTRHPIPTAAGVKASIEIKNIQGQRGIWFSNGYQGYGLYENELKAGLVAAKAILGRNCNFIENPKQMVTSWSESAARLVTVCLEADLGLADAYINGYFSLVDKNEGLLNLFMLLIANIDSNSSDSGHSTKKRNWWKPILLTSSIASLKYVYRHFSRQNSVTQARRNISRHYDVSNDIFSMFLGETMSYSCAMFKSINEDLREAQLRKMCVLIKKARIEENHEVLDIGCGWGTFTIEVVKNTGCKYTGITLSEEQLIYAEKMVKESGFQDRIKFLLCDYRELPHNQKYDRIISCKMIEHVGHEYMEDFFHCCDSVLTDNGLFILQFISYRDDGYAEYRRSPGFIKEYIFPGGCLPSLCRVTNAMAAASSLCLEHLENIGIHYYQTLRCWRQNFLEQQRKIMSLGFDEKFIRTWEYYFAYCAAGFKSKVIHDYQVVFSRTGNVVQCNNHYKDVSSFSCC